MTYELTQDLLENVAKLKPKDRRRVMQHLGQLEYEKCADDIMYWLDSSRHFIPYVYTLDPHELYICTLCTNGASHVRHKLDAHLRITHNIPSPHKKDIETIFKRLEAVRPFVIKEYMPPLIKCMLEEPLMAIEKSRDVIATWTVVVVCTWDAVYHKGRQIIFQSKNSKDSDELVRRAFHIYKNQPKFLRDVVKGEYTIGQTRSGEFKLPSIHSEIIGLPQGSDLIRQYHPSVIFTDETAYQPDAHDTFTAIKPAIQHGGRYIGISSANPGWFQRICQDSLEE